MIVPRAMATAAIFLAMSGLAAAQDSLPADPPAQHQAPPAPTEPGTPQTRADADQLLDLKLRNMILEAKEELRDDDLAILQTILGVLGTFLALLVGSFAYFSYRNARQEVAHAVHEARQAAVEATRSALTEAERIVDRIKEKHAEAEKHVQAMAQKVDPTRASNFTPQEKQEFADSAEAIRKKPRGLLSVDELLVLIGDDIAQRRYEQVIEDATLLRALHPDDDVAVARSWHTQGYAYGELGNNIEALRAYDHLLRRFADSDRTELRERVAMAMFNKGVTLGQMEMPADAIAIYDELLRCFADSDSPALQDEIAKALVNKGYAHVQMERPADAIATYEQLLHRFADSDRPTLQEQIAKALYNKGHALGRMNRLTEEIATYDELLCRFADNDRPKIREPLTWALFNKACALAQQNKTAGAIDALEQWIEKAGKVNCDLLAGDHDFDPIRDDPRFQDFLRRHGCVEGS